MLQRLLSNPIIYLISQIPFIRPRKYFINKLIKKNSKILDLGCGPGHLTKYLRTQDYTGLDNSKKYITLAKERYGGKNFRFLNKNIINQDYSGYKKFDYITIIGVLHHLSDYQIKNLLKSLCKISKKTKIVTFDGYRTTKDNFIKQFLYNNDRGEYIRQIKNYKKLFPTNKFIIKVHKKDYFFYSFVSFELSKK